MDGHCHLQSGLGEVRILPNEVFRTRTGPLQFCSVIQFNKRSYCSETTPGLVMRQGNEIVLLLFLGDKEIHSLLS